MVVADTSAWIDFFRSPTSDTAIVVDGLLATNQIVMVGMVLAEILQGARSSNEFVRLKNRLTTLNFLETNKEVWALVGELSIEIRRNGYTVPITDISIAAVAMYHNHPVFAVDRHFQWIPGLQIYEPEN